jgi:hypothetical protein
MIAGAAGLGSAAALATAAPAQAADGDPLKLGQSNDATATTALEVAGLVLRIPCHIGNAAAPPDGTRLVPKSLVRLPTPDVDLTGISGRMLAARDPAGARVFILRFNTDGLFDTGSDVIRSPDTPHRQTPRTWPPRDDAG